LASGAVLPQLDDRPVLDDVAVGEQQMVGDGDRRALRDVAHPELGAGRRGEHDEDRALDLLVEFLGAELVPGDAVRLPGQQLGRPGQRMRGGLDHLRRLGRPRRQCAGRVGEDLGVVEGKPVVGDLVGHRLGLLQRLGEAGVVLGDAGAAEIAAIILHRRGTLGLEAGEIGRRVPLQRRHLARDARLEGAVAVLHHRPAGDVDRVVLRDRQRRAVGRQRPGGAGIGEDEQDRQHFTHCLLPRWHRARLWQRRLPDR
jgi:hypothetical protein